MSLHPIADSEKKINFLIPELPQAPTPFIVRTPTQYIVLDHLTSTLVTTTKDGDVIGDLAERWDISEDFKTYTFTLNKDSKWSDGSLITVDHVLKHFQGARDFGAAVHIDFKNIEKITKLSDKQFVFSLINPDSSFIKRLQAPENGIIHPENEKNNFQISSGPYYLNKIGEGRLEYKKNRYYRSFGSNAPETVNFIDLKNLSTLKNQLKDGVDFSWVPIDSTHKDHEELTNKGKLSVFSPSISFSHFVTINPLSQTLKNIETRSYIQRKVFQQFHPNNLPVGWHKANQFYLPNSPGTLDHKWQEGFWSKIPNKPTNLPKTLRLIGIKTRPFYKEVSEILKNIGFVVEQQIAENSEEFVKLVKATDKYDIAVTRIDISSEHLIENLSVALNKKAPYIIVEEDSATNKLMTKLEAVSCIEKRKPLFLEISSEILERAYIVPLVHESMIFYYDSRRINLDGLSTLYPDIRFWRTEILTYTT